MVDTIALSIVAVTKIIESALICVTVITCVALIAKAGRKLKDKCGCEFCHTEDKHETNKEVK